MKDAERNTHSLIFYSALEYNRFIVESRTDATINHEYIQIEQVLIELVTQLEFMSEVQCDLSIRVSQSRVVVFFCCQEGKCTTSGATDRKHRRRFVQKKKLLSVDVYMQFCGSFSVCVRRPACSCLRTCLLEA